MLLDGLLLLLDIRALVVVSATLAAGIYYFKEERKGLPPGPTPLPIIGNMLQVLHKGKDWLAQWQDNVTEWEIRSWCWWPGLPVGKHYRVTVAGSSKQWLMYMDWEKTYGRVIRVKIGSNTMVVVLGWDLIKEGLIDNAQLFTDRPQWLYIINQIFNHKGIFWSNGLASREARKFSMVHLRDFGVGKKSLEERVQDEANILVEAVSQNVGKTFSPRALFSYAVTNIICGIVFGQRYNYDDPKFVKLYGHLVFFFKNLGLQVPENFFPFLRYLPFRSAAAPILKNEMEIRKFVEERVKEHRKTFDAANPRDFIDMYLKLEYENKNTETFSEDNVFRVVVDMFLGGSETTSSTLVWIFLYLIRYPDVQTKCQKEIDQVVGDGRQVSLDDRSKTPYLMATIQEVQRCASTVPFVAPHVASANLHLGGHLIPKDTLVLFHLYSAHHDVRYWDQPDEFRPERWVDEEGRLRKREAFMPFSMGPRICIGQALASMELYLFTGTLLQKFRVATPEGGPTPSLEAMQPGFTLQPRPFDIKCTQR